MSDYLFVTSSVSKTSTQQHFTDFTKPTSSAFHEMVIHTVNSNHHSPQEEDDGFDSVSGQSSYLDTNFGIRVSYGRQYMLGQLNLARGNHQSLNPIITGSDEFHEIAPPFVPNLHPHIKVFNLDGHTIMALSASQGFDNIGTATSTVPGGGPGTLFRAGMYDDSATTEIQKNVAPKNNDTDFRYGAIELTTDNDNDQGIISTGFDSFECNNYPWWVKTRFKLSNHDSTTFFFGLTESDGTDNGSGDLVFTLGNPAQDKIGFVKTVNNNDQILINISKNGASAATTTLSANDTGTHQGINYMSYDTDNAILSLGIYWDGDNKLQFYANKVATGQNPGHMKLVKTVLKSALQVGGNDDFPDDAIFRLIFGFERQGAGGTAIMEYMQGAIYTVS